MNKKVILVADDVEMNRSVIKRFFRREYEVLEAADGKETLRVIEENQVDILLLDIIMPEMNGLEVLQAIRSRRELDDMGILVATSVKEKTERQALSAGADDVVSKPYDPVILQKRLDNILAQKALKKLEKVSDLKKHREELEKEVIGRYREDILSKMETVNHISEMMKQNIENQKLVWNYLEEIEKITKEITEIMKH